PTLFRSPGKTNRGLPSVTAMATWKIALAAANAISRTSWLNSCAITRIARHSTGCCTGAFHHNFASLHFNSTAYARGHIMPITTPIDMSTVKGFLADDEAAALHAHALQTAPIGPALEIGSYCGKSTVYLGMACQQQGNILYAVDHHRGSEEHQFGEEYHDPELYDAQAGLMDTFREFRRVMRAAKLEDTVVPIVAPSTVASRRWST